MFNRKKGFSLIELLVVIAVIGLLSSVIVVSLQSSRAKARDAKRVADIESIKTALALYAESNNSHYPPAATVFVDLVNGKFLTDVPVPPNALEVYRYATPTDLLSYHLGADLEQIDPNEGVLRGDSDCNSGIVSPNPGSCRGFSTAALAPFAFDGADSVYDVTP